MIQALSLSLSCSIGSSSPYGRALCLPLLALLLTGCDPTFQLKRTLTFEGSLSKECLIQAATAIDHTLEEVRDNLEVEPFPYLFTVNSNVENEASFFTWNRSEPQDLVTDIFSIGASFPRERELDWCKRSADYLEAVQAECMLQPETTEVVEMFFDASC